MPGALARYQQAALQYSDPSFEAQMVGKAIADAQDAFSTQKAAMTRDMARYGLNPASGRWGSMLNQAAIQGAAMQAGAANDARQFVQDKRFATAKDFYSSLTGMPSEAAAAAGRAASGYTQLGQNKQAAAQNNAAGWQTALGVGMGAFFAKDGGEVRLANGGGIIPRIDMPPPPQPAYAPQQQSPAAATMQGVKIGKGLVDAYSGAKAGVLTNAVGGAATQLGNLTGSVGLSAWGTGAKAAAGGADLASAIGAYTKAAETASLAGNTALAAEMTSAAQGLSSGAAAASGALGTVSAALPWIGVAAALGSLFGLFADGGSPPDIAPGALEMARANVYESLFNEPYIGSEEQIARVQQLVQLLSMQEADDSRVDMTPGGPVVGPGTETSDSVPARLSRGEFVVNAEAMKDPKDAALVRRINEKGLRRRYGNDAPIANGELVSEATDTQKASKAKTEGQPRGRRKSGLAKKGR